MVPAGWPPGELVDADLPLYVVPAVEAERRAALWHERRRRAEARLASGIAPSARFSWTAWQSPCFARLIDVRGDLLSAVLQLWWSGCSVKGVVRLGGCLVVSAPHVEDGLWTFAGHLRRGAGRRAIPMVVYLWAYNGWFTRIELVPRARVLTTRRYFRLGHRALDALTRELTGSDSRRQSSRRAMRMAPERARS